MCVCVCVCVQRKNMNKYKPHHLCKTCTPNFGQQNSLKN